MKDYLLLNLSKKEVTLYKKCFDKNGSPKRIDNIEWQFLDNPKNRAFVKIAFDQERDTVAAIYAASCLNFKIEGKIETGTQSLDTITDIEYRGKGMFTNLAKLVYNYAAENNVVLVYGFPNGNSVHGFTKKLNWKLLDPVPFLFKPLKTGYFFKKILGSKIGDFLNFNLATKKRIEFGQNEKISPIGKFSENVNLLWNEFSAKIGVCVQRNADYLNWRFVDKPNENYKRYGLYREDKLLGFIVYANKSKHSGNIGYIMELIVLPNETEAGKKLLQLALNDFIKSKVDVILSWCFHFSPNFMIYKHKGFYDLPERLRPIELHFGYLNLNANEAVLSKRENWYLSYADSDTV